MSAATMLNVYGQDQSEFSAPIVNEPRSDSLSRSVPGKNDPDVRQGRFEEKGT